MERNSGIFWAMLQCSLLIGNTFVYFAFQDTEDIDKDLRTLVKSLIVSKLSYRITEFQITGSLSFAEYLFSWCPDILFTEANSMGR